MLTPPSASLLSSSFCPEPPAPAPGFRLRAPSVPAQPHLRRNQTSSPARGRLPAAAERLLGGNPTIHSGTRIKTEVLSWLPCLGAPCSRTFQKFPEAGHCWFLSSISQAGTPVRGSHLCWPHKQERGGIFSEHLLSARHRSVPRDTVVTKCTGQYTREGSKEADRQIHNNVI